MDLNIFRSAYTRFADFNYLRSAHHTPQKGVTFNSSNPCNAKHQSSNLRARTTTLRRELLISSCAISWIKHQRHAAKFCTIAEYRGTSLIRKCNPLGPYRRPVPRVPGGPGRVGVFLWARYPCKVTTRLLSALVRTNSPAYSIHVIVLHPCLSRLARCGLTGHYP